MPSCKDATMLVEKRLQQPVSFIERMGLALHLLICKYCRRYAKQSSIIDAAVHESQEQQPSATNDVLDENIKQAWENMIAENMKKNNGENL
ncbi:anti-sigma factor family protein [Chitinophaga vietnamensis]|uniref:anti-sigma factor family protein n=1 Tax=Chitinophaga vietnamensis TaxID=2593957 RepID=UPI0011779D8D|nr:hypothetical protein [Chitinophaga vietnamensis]